MELVARAFAPKAIVSEVARCADVHPGQLYRWRAEFGGGMDGASNAEFAQVVVGDDASPADEGAAIRVRLGCAQVEIAGHASCALVTATLKALMG